MDGYLWRRLPVWQQACMRTYIKKKFSYNHFQKGDLTEELGDVLQPGHGAVDPGQCVRATVSVRLDQEQQLAGLETKTTGRAAPNKAAEAPGPVRNQSWRNLGRPQVGNGTAGQPGWTPGLRPPQKRQSVRSDAHRPQLHRQIYSRVQSIIKKKFLWLI